MFKKYTLLTVTAVTLSLAPWLQHNLKAFEIFPRPEAQYTVKRGDTLYGISGYYYSDPALWPFLWNQNPALVMKDKGGAPSREPLTSGLKINLFAPRTSSTVVDEEYHAPTGIPDDVRYLVNKVPRKGIPYEKHYFRYKLSNRPIRVWGYIVSSPAVEKSLFLERDLVYIRFRPSKKQAILVGDRFGIYRSRGPLTHPLNPSRNIGFVSEIVGEVEITSTSNELVTAIITESFVEVITGDKICLFAPREREIVPTKVHRMLTGTILESATRQTFFRGAHNFENDIVFINRGECDGMKEGTLLNIYRPTERVQDPYFRGRHLSIPDRFVGEGMILKAFEKNSTVLVTRMREEILPGDVIKTVSD